MLAFRREWGKGGGCAPCTPLGGGRELALAGRAPFPTFPRVRGQGQRYPRRGAPPVPCWGNGGFVVACALLQRGDWLSLRRCPTGPPSNVFGNRGTRCTPGGGCAPAPCLGDGGVASLPSAECGGRGKMRLLDGWSCCGLRSSSAEGLPWPAPLSHLAHPPTFLETGGHAVPPAGLRPLHPAWGTGGLLRLAPSFSGGVGLACAVVPPAPPPTFLETGGLAVPPAGAAPPAPCLGDGGFVLACALLQRWGWLGVRRCPTWPTLQRSWKQGDTLYPRRGLRPLHPAWGTGVLFWLAPSFSGGAGLACVVVPPAHPPTFLETGGLPLYARRGLRPLHAAWGTGGASLSHLPPSAGGGTRCACWMGGFVVACAVLQRGDWLGVRRCPTGPPSNVFRNRGTPPCTPGGGCAPCTPPPHTHTPISARWLSSVSAQTRASRRSGLAPLSGVQVQSWSSRSSRPGPTWKTFPCS